jgi:hypothetical protein
VKEKAQKASRLRIILINSIQISKKVEILQNKNLPKKSSQKQISKNFSSEMRESIEDEKKAKLAEEDRIRRERLEKIQKVNGLVSWGAAKFSVTGDLKEGAFTSDVKAVLERCNWDEDNAKGILEATWPKVGTESFRLFLSLRLCLINEFFLSSACQQ